MAKHICVLLTETVRWRKQKSGKPVAPLCKSPYYIYNLGNATCARSEGPTHTHTHTHTFLRNTERRCLSLSEQASSASRMQCSSMIEANGNNQDDTRRQHTNQQHTTPQNTTNHNTTTPTRRANRPRHNNNTTRTRRNTSQHGAALQFIT